MTTGGIPTLDDISLLEAQNSAAKPTLGLALEMLDRRWAAGFRDRETALRRMFLGWYACAEPRFLTGISRDVPMGRHYLEVFTHFGGESSDDAEFLLTAGYMASLFPFCLGDEATWAAIGQRCLMRGKLLHLGDVTPDAFRGRGTYGDYFANVTSRREPHAKGWFEEFVGT